MNILYYETLISLWIVMWEYVRSSSFCYVNILYLALKSKNIYNVCVNVEEEKKLISKFNNNEFKRQGIHFLTITN